MTCPVCAAATPASAKFCGECGAPLNLKLCASCGAMNDRAAAVCTQCSTSFDGLAARSAGQTPGQEDYRALLKDLERDVTDLIGSRAPGPDVRPASTARPPPAALATAGEAREVSIIPHQVQPVRWALVSLLFAVLAVSVYQYYRWSTANPPQVIAPASDPSSESAESPPAPRGAPSGTATGERAGDKAHR